MRKAQKEQVNNFISLLAEAQEEIKNAVRKKNVPLALDLLEQCQQGAIHLGTLIDNLEGEGHPTVALLEQYCEVVYKLHEQLAAETLKAGTDAASYVKQQLDMVLTQITNSAEKDIPVRLEVVFCPYKASMWDSLESVWKAASEDVNCDTYVIPIPYYDKNSDGSFREEHYEGLEYPEYVPITYYKSYNFEERKPDVVFIHNPYDEYNYVTSVHPFFYASNLVKYTEKLVYIPYFVLNEMNPDNMSPEAKEKMKSFVVQPGVICSQRVIVQSETMKQVYVNILSEQFGEEHRSIWEEKILGLGSPKLDKVQNITEEDIKIPEEWKPVLYKADGSRRKTILYNTSVVALLEHGDKMLDKMRSVFRIFYKNREEIALLWRPHPLIKATIEAMRPKLWEEYKKIVNMYKEASWGIYDDTAELNRAIELSDAYYGDQSSLVQLYIKVGKPVMIQASEIYEKNSIHYISYEGTYDDGAYLWMVDMHINALYKVDKVTEHVNYIGSFPKEKMTQEMLYRDVARYGDKLYFSPYMAKNIGVYNMKTGEFEEKVIPNANNYEALFYKMLQVESQLYFIPYFYNKITILNCKEDSVQFIDAFEKKKHKGGEYFLSGIRHEDMVIFPSASEDGLFIYNIGTGKYRWIHNICPRERISGVHKKDNIFYFSTFRGNLYKYKLDDGVFSLLNIFTVSAFKEKVFILKEIHNKLYFYVDGEQKYYRFHLDAEEVFLVDDFKELSCSFQDWRTPGSTKLALSQEDNMVIKERIKNEECKMQKENASCSIDYIFHKAGTKKKKAEIENVGTKIMKKLR